MSQIVYEILDYELTPIPAALGNLLGVQINNCLCNGAFWLLVLWTSVHVVFDVSLYSMLAKAGYKPYACTRLVDGLWSVFVSLLSFSYFFSVVAKYRLDLFNWHSKFLHANLNPPSDVSIGIILLSTFYLHMTLYQPIKLDGTDSILKYLLLSIIYALTYINRKIEIPLLMPLFVGASDLSIAMTRILFCATENHSSWMRKIKKGAFAISLVLWIAVYIVVIPLRLVLFPVKRIWYDFRTAHATLFLLLIVWFVVNLYESVLLKWFSHWLEHTKDEKYSMLSESALDFSLFDVRRDSAYYWKTLRSEMKTRGDEMVARRKPNNRNVLFQTIKCMLAIRRKKNEKKDGFSTVERSETPLVKQRMRAKHQVWRQKRNFRKQNWLSSYNMRSTQQPRN
ncbi:uncharacterized protein LOC143204242 isoform X2 [Rhynchophorus ferrugineus]|uniref:uncharacterized protein LOC143204242 isoform X2 n=1 Tax=Rhynchophorus ferrugineus TaxID=354439 RepID=UPI003FCEDB9D